MATNNPLDQFKSSPVTSGDFKIHPLPNMRKLVQEHGLMEGCQQFDAQMEDWRQQFERALNERLSNI